MEVKNGYLIVGEHRLELPDINQDVRVRVWSVPEEYRPSGIFFSLVHPGEPLEIPACSAADASLLGDVDYPASDARKLAAAKAAKLSELNASCERALSELSSAYPAGELQSWPQQVAEAVALQADPPGAAPLLTAISEARGVPVNELAKRVQQKASAYAEFSGVLIGKRQRLEDELASAETLEAVSAISW